MGGGGTIRVVRGWALTSPYGHLGSDSRPEDPWSRRAAKITVLIGTPIAVLALLVAFLDWQGWLKLESMSGSPATPRSTVTPSLPTTPESTGTDPAARRVDYVQAVAPICQSWKRDFEASWEAAGFSPDARSASEAAAGFEFIARSVRDLAAKIRSVPQPANDTASTAQVLNDLDLMASAYGALASAFREGLTTVQDADAARASLDRYNKSAADFGFTPECQIGNP